MMGCPGDTRGCGITAEAFYEALLHGFEVDVTVGHPRQVCVFGSVPQAVSCKAASDMADHMLSTPVFVVTDGRIPGWIGDGTLCVVIEDGAPEGLIRELERLGAEVVPLAASEGYLPEGFYLGAVLGIMRSAGIIETGDGISSSVSLARSFASSSGPTAQKLAQSLRGRVPAFYSTSATSVTAEFWAHLVASAADSATFHGELPEFDHNELVGWSDPNAHAPGLEIVVLRTSCESDMVRTIVDCMVEVLTENGRPVTVTDIPGSDPFTADLCAIGLGIEVSRAMEASR